MEDFKMTAQYGHDDASDVRGGTNATISPVTREMALLNLDSRDRTCPEFPPGHLLMPMPQLSSGLVTFAYKRALLNRIKEHKLNEGGRYDLCKFTPTFVHDTLMLPGSLADLIGKGSSEDVLRRMTPALLPGHHIHINPKGNMPCLVASRDPTSCVQGMVLFGQGKPARDFIHKHYRNHAKRKKVPIEIEVMALKKPQDRQHEHDFWEPQRRTIYVHAWKRSGSIEGCDAGKENAQCPNWTLEDYLAGTLSPELPMRIETSAKGDEDADGYLGRDFIEYDIEVEKREVMYGGPGRLHYERIKGDGGFGW